MARPSRKSPHKERGALIGLAKQTSPARPLSYTLSLMASLLFPFSPYPHVQRKEEPNIDISLMKIIQ